MEKLYTLQETADLLKVSTRTVLRYIKSGKLKATKIGQWRINEISLQNFLSDNQNSNNYVEHDVKRQG
jgi:excisionase family DNA binding protein